MSMIQNKLEEKAREGKRIVVLVDEAHAMPLDTLEELRLLYNLQVGDSKLLQIVLFGQPELNTKLNQPNMRQLKDRIVHHFHMQPLSRNILESYLMFRMRAAGYKGPDIFSPAALKLLADTSNGLMRRVNILADKSLLAAFVEDTYYIKPQHVQAAIRDSELSPARSLPGKKMLIGGAAAALVLIVSAVWFSWDRNQGSGNRDQVTASNSAPVAPADDLVLNPSAERPAVNNEQKPVVNNAESSNTPLLVPPVPVADSSPMAEQSVLFEQRLAAGKQLLEQTTSTGSGQGKAAASIQLFYKEEAKRERIEGFLKRADGLGVLTEIYLLPVQFGNKDGLRVLYGAYPSIDAARNAAKDLPKRYQDAFATSIYIW